MNLNLKKKVAIVTGGTRGLGEKIIRVLAEQGVYLTVADLKINEEMIANYNKLTKIIGVNTNVMQEKSVKDMARKTVDAYGEINILINNAGIIYKAPLEEIDREKWQAVMDVNLTGAMLCAKTVVPYMKRLERGRIINISSVQAFIGTPMYSAYSASKAGLVQLTKVWANELASNGITVNAICPGYMNTPMSKNTIMNIAAQKGLTFNEALSELVEPVPQKRLIDVREVASLIVYLCSDLAKAITGEAIIISGGWVMH